MKITIENKNIKMSKLCKFCKNEIPAGRLKALPTAVTCVECSTAGMKRGVPVQLGSGDHTCTELLIMEEDTYFRYMEMENEIVSKPIPSFEDDLDSDPIPNDFNLEQIDFTQIDNSNLTE
jgi:hypothetical protein